MKAEASWLAMQPLPGNAVLFLGINLLDRKFNA